MNLSRHSMPTFRRWILDTHPTKIHMNYLSFRSQGRPSLWRPWTGRRCPLNKRSGSRVCGSAAFLLQTGVSAGGGESETASWNFEDDIFIVMVVVVCTNLGIDCSKAAWTWKCVHVPVDAADMIDFLSESMKASAFRDLWCDFKADFLFVKMIFLHQFFSLLSFFLSCPLCTVSVDLCVSSVIWKLEFVMLFGVF